ncbi:penicillin-binding transpeptidase domain-containing protein, partial [Patulibacter sp. S7RM1-6]
GGPLGRGPLVPAVVVLLLAVGIGGYLVLDARASRRAESDLVDRYVRAWEHRDFAAMYRELSDAARGRTDAARFAAVNRRTLDTATVTALDAGEPRRTDDGFAVPVVARTRLFGTLRGTVDLPLDGDGADARVRWARRLALPGLRDGETVSRTTEMPARADILARDGTPLAQGSDRTSGVPNIASQVVGTLGTANAEDRAALRRLGVPDDAKVGVSGLERILNAQLVGRPGGTLRAGRRVLARVAPKKASAVRSSIDLAVVKAAVEAQSDAPDVTGTMVVNARTGEVLGFQGSAWSALQPPGSTMKIVTAAAALQDGVAKTTTQYPHETEAKGFGIENSNGESCGGTLVQSFAHSCNSVFVPMGAKLGPKRLVEMAEAFGFNRKTAGVPGAQTSTIPAASTMSGVGEAAASAIGQGRVQATALQVALMTATVANGGRQPELSFVRRTARARSRKVLDRSVASAMRQLMLAVVRDGTGEDARVQLSGVTTAGKTGTAELATTQGDACDAQEEQEAAEAQPDDVTEAPEPPSPCGNADGKSTTAWMAAYASKGGGDPVAVGVLRARNFQGGATAAPVARRVLTAALED